MIGLTLSPRALRRLQVLCHATTPARFFRVTVSSGGCKGFQYIFELDDKKNSDDGIFTFEDVEVVVDSASLSFLKDAIIDFEEDLMGHYFFIQKPESKGSCGCGNSFSV